MTVIHQDGTSTPSKQTRLLSHPLAVNSGKDPANFSFLGYGQSPRAGGMSPGGLGYSPSSPNAYSPTLPYVPQSPFGQCLLLVHHCMPPHRSMTMRAGVDQYP